MFPGKSTFFELRITQKRFIFEESYISNGKRQKSCTLIVIYVILLIGKKMSTYIFFDKSQFEIKGWTIWKMKNRQREE